MSLSLNFPTTNPSLMIDFVNRSTLDSRVTFTRASSATYFDSSGVITTAAANVPRFDHNPSTLQPRGLLIEEQRTNLEPNSEAMTSVTGASILSNVTTAPSGLTTADKLVEDTATGGHYVATNSVTWVGNTAYTFTIFLKADTRTQVQIAFGTSSNWVAGQRNGVFDVLNGTVLATSGANVIASIEAVGNGWYRCRQTCTTVAVPTAPSTIQVQLYVGGTASYTGDGTSGLFFWGAQVEVGSFPTSYIPTSGTALTRNADVASMTGTNFSSWYNQSAGTLFGQFSASAVASGAASVAAALTDGTTSERMFMRIGGGVNALAVFIDGGVTQASLDTGSYSLGTMTKIAMAYAVNNFAATQNAGTVQTGTSGTLPTVNQLNLGTQFGSATWLNGHIQRLSFYPTRLPNATLQALTL